MEDFGPKNVTIEQIVKDYLGLVYSFVFRFTGQGLEASDITQEVFVKVWKNLDRYDPQKSLKTWILAIARNTAVDWLRKKRPILFSDLSGQGERGEDQDFGDSLADDSFLPDEIFEQEELKIKLEELIKRLSLDQREVFLLHFGEDLTFETISEILGRPRNTVKSQYRRALLNLRRYLMEES